MPAEEFHLDFVKSDKSSRPPTDKEDAEKEEKPWYKRLLPA
jgi:hypothetical protein